MADKTELYHLASRINVLTSTRTENVLTDKVKEHDPNRFGRVLIREITQVKLSEYYRVYRLNAYTSSGHYNISILDRG
jgi:hypothetical protein